MNGALLSPADRVGVQLVTEDLVLFIYSVKPGCKFHWLLGLYALHPTCTPYGMISIRLPSQVIA